MQAGVANFEYPTIMKPLEPYREHTVILSGLWSKSAEPPPGQTGADHWVAAAYLCADKPKKTTGAKSSTLYGDCLLSSGLLTLGPGLDSSSV